MEKDIDIYNSKENCNIKAKFFYNEEPNTIKHVFIFCHGFCSGKGSNSVRIVADMLLKQNISSIAFDFPGHVDSVQGSDKLRVSVCVSYINSVIDYIKENYGDDIRISFYAISFGAYILLNKLIGDEANYANIVIRSPAFNMKDILVKSLLKETFEKYKEKGKAKAGYGGKIEVLYSFYQDLAFHDLYKNYNEKRNIIIIQGDLDDTAPIQDTYNFIRNRPEIELIRVENMKHHMGPEEILETTEIMLRRIDIS